MNISLKSEPVTPLPYRLLMMDIDGTLLDEEGKITPRTRAAVRSALEAGILVTLATARRHFSAALFAADLGLDAPIVSYDGALICEHPDSAIWHTDPLPALLGQTAIDAIQRYGMQPIVQYSLPDGEHVCTGPESGDTVWEANYFRIFSAQIERRSLDDLCADEHDPLRVVAFGPEDRLELVAAELRRLSCQLYFNPLGSYHSPELAVMSPTASKGNALSVIASRLNIPMSQTVTIGDSFNDISMLGVAGLGVAMGQAPDEVRTTAHVLTLPNTDDGAAVAIERYILSTLNGHHPR